MFRKTNACLPFLFFLSLFAACNYPRIDPLGPVGPVLPTACFKPCMMPWTSAGQPIQFLTDCTQDGETWLWDFGDPGSGAFNTSTDSLPTHVFSNGGQFTIKLTVTNAEGSSVTMETISIQNVPQQWFDSIPSPSWQQANHVSTTQDGGFLISGYRAEGPDSTATYSEMLLAKIRSNGVLDWGMTYSGLGSVVRAAAALELKTGEIMLYGHSSITDSDGEIILKKLTATGAELWSKQYDPTSLDDVATSMVRTEDGSIFLAGGEKGVNQTGFLLKVDANGSMLASKTWTNRFINQIKISKTDPLAILFAGTERNAGSGKTEMIFGKYNQTDLSAIQPLKRAYVSGGNVIGLAIEERADSTLFVAGQGELTSNGTLRGASAIWKAGNSSNIQANLYEIGSFNDAILGIEDDIVFAGIGMHDLGNSTPNIMWGKLNDLGLDGYFKGHGSAVFPSFGYAITATFDRGYLLVGHTIENGKAIIIHTHLDANGN